MLKNRVEAVAKANAVADAVADAEAVVVVVPDNSSREIGGFFLAFFPVVDVFRKASDVILSGNSHGFIGTNF
ncbi:hypothetical protein [Flavobacterium sp.]|uniref:hypothetical protein n=1 Tax=Flavobacterium sp. TaxID=239 RepID=UPI0011F88A8F|nr:hypothetical protein [Flavobacterium sp.]RZJ72945.1 MAG: hypothetical protein EOO49_04760 [Flavobacterium sp.]